MKKFISFFYFISLCFCSTIAQPESFSNNYEKFSSLFKTSNISKNKFSLSTTSLWIEEFAKAERWMAGMRPTVSSRALAYIHMAAYETYLPATKDFISNQTYLKDLKIPKFSFSVKNIHWNLALNACYFKLDSLFLIGAKDENKLSMKVLRDSLNEVYSRNLSSVRISSSISWGIAVADAIYDFAKADKEGERQRYNPYPKEYQMPSNVGAWIGERHGGYLPFTPDWGRVRSFTNLAATLIAEPPPKYDTSKKSDYYKAHLEVYNEWKNMDYEKRWRSEFWSDDIVNFTYGPSVRYFIIAKQIVEKECMNLEDALHFYCKLGIGLNDAMVVCWRSKYAYWTERPWQFIKVNIDSNYRSIMGEPVDQAGKNPPFPSYPSGHSSCAGVSEIIFTTFVGNEYLFTDYSHLGRKEFMSTPRTFFNMREMAEENAYSRIPMGAHTRFDCDEGLRIGRLVGIGLKIYNLKRK